MSDKKYLVYFIKILNTKNNNVVGYYKEKGVTNISRIKKGIKFWNKDDLDEALEVCNLLDKSFVRDSDKHYYTAHAVIVGELVNKPIKKPMYLINEEERKSEVEAFIRQNYSRISE